MEAERYQVREVTGYSTLTAVDSRTDVMVLDPWNCWKVVAFFSGVVRGHPGRYATLAEYRERAAALAARWNAE